MQRAAVNQQQPFSSILIFMSPQHSWTAIDCCFNFHRRRRFLLACKKNLSRVLMGFLMSTVDEETFKT